MSPDPLQPGPPQTLWSILEGAPGDVTALVSAESGSRVSFGELTDRSEQLAADLAVLGVEHGDSVAIALPSGPGLIELIFAIVSLGAAAAPLNPSYTRSEFRFYLEDLRARLLVLPFGKLSAAREAARDVAVEVIDAEITGMAPCVLRRPPDRRKGVAKVKRPAPGDIALLLHTSGTTSRPKQVPLRHENLISSIQSIVGHYQLTEADVSFCAMPLFHVHGLVANVWASLAAHAPVVVPQRLSGNTFWRALAESEITWYSASPTIHQMLIEHKARPASTAARRGALRFIRSCSSALAPALLHELEGCYGVPALEAYGMTEASHQIASNPLPPHRRLPGSVGTPTGVEARIISRTGEGLGNGSTGEVVIRGASVMRGYLSDSDTESEYFVDGWFRTGDLGEIDAAGYLHLKGRLKELIIRGGENIAPPEIEAVLLDHPAVTDAVCFGLPDEKYGESVAAAVAVSQAVTERSLRDHCRSRLATFKVPAVIYVLDALPRTATGKIQRRRMPALLEGLIH